MQTQATPPSTGNVSRKGKEKAGETPFMADVSSGSSHADMDSDGSEQSLDEEFGIPAVRHLVLEKHKKMLEDKGVTQDHANLVESKIRLRD